MVQYGRYKMKFTQIQVELYAVLQRLGGEFRDAYQICDELRIRYPELARQIEEEYSESRYSLAAFIANALSYFSRNDSRVQQQGEQRNGRWAWQENLVG